MILAMTEADAGHAYGPEVEYEIRERVRADYARAAELVNYSDARLVSVQHEHGIFVIALTSASRASRWSSSSASASTART
jgi:hypothetical protein